MKPSLNNNWEVVSFREFLLETCSFEHVFFYLQVRSYLLGHDLSTHVSSHFESYFYVRVSQAERVLRLFLSHINKNLINSLYSSLRMSTVRVNGQKCVESGFTLRLFLEFYKAHRHKETGSLFSSIQQVSSCKQRPVLNFQQFCQVMQHKFRLSHLTIIKLYRGWFSAREGGVTAEALLLGVTEKRLHCQWVLEKIH